MCVQDKSCNITEGLQLYQKDETPTQLFYCEKYIPKALETTFFVEQLWWLLLNYQKSIRKEFLKTKISGEIAFCFN